MLVGMRARGEVAHVTELRIKNQVVAIGETIGVDWHVFAAGGLNPYDVFAAASALSQCCRYIIHCDISGHFPTPFRERSALDVLRTPARVYSLPFRGSLRVGAIGTALVHDSRNEASASALYSGAAGRICIGALDMGREACGEHNILREWSRWMCFLPGLQTLVILQSSTGPGTDPNQTGAFSLPV